MPKVIKKKILTEDDLLRFCEEQKFARFSSKDTGYQLAVKVPTTFEVDDNVDNNHRGMMRLKFRIFHTGLNRNKSYVSNEAAEKAMNTIADRPVLAAIHQLDDGTWDFNGHEMEVVKDENGNEETRYIESQVGSFSSEPAFWEHDDELNKDYVCAYAYISEEYTRACDIIRQKNGSKNSCELFIDELSYNAKEHYLDLINFYVNASTLLGSRDDGTKIEEGMQGSRADIADFSVENNSVKFDKDAKLIELLEDLNKTISNFNKEQNSKEGGDKENMNKFEELCQKYGKSADDITFDYENMTDEELETKFSEMFDGEGEAAGDDAAANSDGQTAGDSSTEVTDTNAEGSSGTGSTDENTSTDPNPDETTDDNTEGTTPEDPDDFPKKQTMQRTFEVSHDDIRYALYTLLQPYEEADNAWYWIVDVYDSYFVYEGSGKYYGQKYSVEDDNVAFNEERYELFAEFLTASEKAALSDMRANYTALKEFKEDAEKNELHEQREKILADQKFESVANTEAFKELVRNMDNYSLEDLEKEAKIVFADNVELISNSDAKSGVKIFANVNKNSKPKKRYGNLFD
nr:MAG TPA: hypothetical protein [Bacteriophage sp.]